MEITINFLLNIIVGRIYCLTNIKFSYKKRL